MALENWPLFVAVVEDAEDYEAAQDAIMQGCYGLKHEDGQFDPAELPDSVRSGVLIACQAMVPAPDDERSEYSVECKSARLTLLEMPGEPEWNLYTIAEAPLDIWAHDQSPMSGAILSPRDIARLIANILDAAPPSLLASPDTCTTSTCCRRQSDKIALRSAARRVSRRPPEA